MMILSIELVRIFIVKEDVLTEELGLKMWVIMVMLTLKGADKI